MTFQDTLSQARSILNGYHSQLLALTTAYNLTLQIDNRSKRAHDGGWLCVVDVDNPNPLYRAGFNISVSPRFSKLGTVRIWSLVTDLTTNAWQQHIVDNVPLKDLGEETAVLLTKVSGWLVANDKLDPEALHCEREGTAYYWRKCASGGWVTDFGTDDYFGGIDKEDDKLYTGCLCRSNTETTELAKAEGKSRKAVIRKLEAAFKALPL